MRSKLLNRIHAERPVVHCISNYVTANDCANLLLAVGASPIMADAPCEMRQINDLCAAHVLNLGTLSVERAEAMQAVVHAVNTACKPLVLDPVGVSCSSFRLETANQLLKQTCFSIIRANSSEIKTLLDGTAGHGGVDADMEVSCENALLLAKKYGAVVLMSGDVDVITDGKRIYRVYNGHEMMRAVTGSGCMLSALAGAFLTVVSDAPLEAALAAACVMGICGERAHRRMNPLEGNASFRNCMIDAAYQLTTEDLKREARYEI